MLKRTLYFTTPCYLSTKNKQLLVNIKDIGQTNTVPIEDIGFILIENLQITLSLPLIEELMNNNVCVIFCNSKHHPQSMLLNMQGNHQQTEIFRQQISASEPLKKNLWKQTIIAKILNQSNVLNKLGIDSNPLAYLAKQVKSGDSDNREGIAARLYWKKLFGVSFSRERDGDRPNDLLNYGYIVLRAAVARALTASGLLPSLGIFHSNRYNAFCLADDIMEPYRPFVDLCVWDISQKYPEIKVVEKELKGEILGILSSDVLFKKQKRPLMIAITNTTASLAACFAGTKKQIEFPSII